MSLKRTVQYWRIGFIAISIMILLSVSGCSDTHLEDEQVVESEIAVQDQQQNVKDNEDEIIEIEQDNTLKIILGYLINSTNSQIVICNKGIFVP